MRSTRLELLRRIQRAYPADLWANHELAFELMESGQSAEAIRYFTAALALRPRNPGNYLNRGRALGDAGEVDAAIADYRQSLALAPQYAAAHHNLGLALKDKGQLDEAIAEFKEALRIKSDDAEAHHNLGVALTQKGQLDEAIAEFKEGLRIKSDDAEAHYSLGNALRNKGLVDEAIAEYREAIRIKKDYAEAHCNLGNALQRQGEFRAAREELRRGHELGSRNPRWPYPSAQWVRKCERLIELDGRLPGFLEGTFTPASPGEQMELAQLCQGYRKQYAAAARFYAEAFAEQPKLADDLSEWHRYNAACAAALAGCGQGKDADKLDDKERARLRRQTWDWLRADLGAWVRLLNQEPDKVRPVLLQRMRHWLQDPDFAGVRGSQALAKLPEAERQLWQKLWADTAEMLARTQTKTTTEKKADAK
jgi:tetratricopeptide (TPR) repeat protein